MSTGINMTTGSESSCLIHRMVCTMTSIYDIVAINQKVFEWMVLENNVLGVSGYF